MIHETNKRNLQVSKKKADWRTRDPRNKMMNKTDKPLVRPKKGKREDTNHQFRNVTGDTTADQ